MRCYVPIALAADTKSTKGVRGTMPLKCRMSHGTKWYQSPITCWSSGDVECFSRTRQYILAIQYKILAYVYFPRKKIHAAYVPSAFKVSMAVDTFGHEACASPACLGPDDGPKGRCDIGKTPLRPNGTWQMKHGHTSTRGRRVTTPLVLSRVTAAPHAKDQLRSSQPKHCRYT